MRFAGGAGGWSPSNSHDWGGGFGSDGASVMLGKNAGVAAQLLGVDRVRLYQDCIFKKRAGDEPTNWHSDLHTSPLDTNGFVTCWFPLHAVPAS